MLIDEKGVRSWKFKYFLLRKLPMAFLAGLAVSKLDDSSCVVNIRYKWLNQNPFRSIYFACLMMAGELSTGVLVMREIQASNRKMSMLVTQTHSAYFKKALGRIEFVCADGKQCRKTIQKALETGNGETMELKSQAFNSKGELVAEIKIEWSVKLKKP